ncbi:hypothetical protein FZW96_02120 [Bacillus sp. BGMRC 2118]|nr:hypothetical protein FZW96_02120 [Bacillus sp. BGMRC 2118]
MYRTHIDGQEIVIRCTHPHHSKDSHIEMEAIKSILQLNSKLLLYRNQCIATIVDSVGYIIAYIQDGEIIDVQIQNIVPLNNVIRE